MIDPIGVEEFLNLRQRYPVIDVRTPAEFARGHIPGAFNLPLFSNEERASIGQTYQQAGRTEAMLLGLDAAGPKMRAIIERIQTLAPEKSVLVHCWRGGMRSQSVGWLADFFGYRTHTLKGGYKAFRTYVLTTLTLAQQVHVLAGKTGAGKTCVLQEMKRLGAQVIDLEALAHHKGSAFGALGETAQPTQQQFENDLALIWDNIDPQLPVWIEDESRYVGKICIPVDLWRQMQVAPTVCLKIPLNLRTQYLVEEYGRYPRPALRESIMRLEKRLGPQLMRQALEALESDKLATCCQLLLQAYYDKTYTHSLSNRDPASVQYLEFDGFDPAEIAKRILGLVG